MSHSAKLQVLEDSCSNRLLFSVCTRGSAESLVVLLPVLLTVWIASAPGTNKCFSAFLAGLCHGVAVHAKLYPIIYSLSFMTSFAEIEANAASPNGAFSILFRWVRRLLRPAPLLFALTFLTVFVLLTYLGVVFYGPLALEEGKIRRVSFLLPSCHRLNLCFQVFSTTLLELTIVTTTPCTGIGSIYRAGLEVPTWLLLVNSYWCHSSSYCSIPAWELHPTT